MFSARVDLRLGHVPTKVSRRNDARISIVCGGEELIFDELLVATGRQPNSDLLDVDAAGIKCHRHGTVQVDDTLATNVSGIWAIGDVANSYQLKHLANAEAAVAFWNIAHPGDVRHQSYKAIPGAVFSHPQIATVGLTEVQAVEAGLPIKVGRRDYAGTAYGWAPRRRDIVRQGHRERADRAVRGRSHHWPAGSNIDPADHPGDGA